MERIYFKASDGSEISFLFSKSELRENTPCILFIHGGGWSSCSADYYLCHMSEINKRGAAAASAEYRLKTENIPLETCINDCVDIVKYIRSHSDALGIIPDRLCVVGESAGGHLALCLASPLIVGDEGARPDLLVNLNGVVDMTGVFKDRFFDEKELSDLSDPERWLERYAVEEKLSPLYNVSEGNSPTIHVQGLCDLVVKPEETLRYHKELLSHGVKSELILLPNLSHAFILFDYDNTDETVIGILSMLCDKLAEYKYLK